MHTHIGEEAHVLLEGSPWKPPRIPPMVPPVGRYLSHRVNTCMSWKGNGMAIWRT